MGLFGNKASRRELQATVANLAYENADLEKRNKDLLAEVASTGVLLQSARDGRDIAYRQAAHLNAERNKLANELAAANARLARLTTRGPGGRFVKPPVAAAEMGAGL
jgi:chromosome segregation ATPase